jgi:hypothetical protein
MESLIRLAFIACLIWAAFATFAVGLWPVTLLIVLILLSA